MKVQVTMEFDDGDRALVGRSGYAAGRVTRAGLATHEAMRLFVKVASDKELGELMEQFADADVNEEWGSA